MSLLTQVFLRHTTRRSVTTSAAMFRLRDRFLWESDKDKRPSELEIKQKKLPPNTPTLGNELMVMN